MKLASTDFAALMLTVHTLPLAESQPVQALKVDPSEAVAVSVTVVPLSKSPEHVDPQLIPAGLDVTVPFPMPDFVTVMVWRSFVNVGTTDRDAFIVTSHVVPFVASQPVHPSNREPGAGDAVSVIVVPASYDAVQLSCVVPQDSPPALEVTSPRPFPALLTVSVGLLNVAVTVRPPLTVTEQVAPDALSQPLHPTN